jgi:transcriptional regulator GlxA family with amidase domain
MRADFGNPALQLDDVAARIATSRRQLQRCFQELSDGESYRACITRIRMEEAAVLLATSTRPVREIAHTVGYLQPAQFAKAFRRHHGMPPSEFRVHARAAPAESSAG